MNVQKEGEKKKEMRNKQLNKVFARECNQSRETYINAFILYQTIQKTNGVLFINLNHQIPRLRGEPMCQILITCVSLDWKLLILWSIIETQLGKHQAQVNSQDPQ